MTAVDASRESLDEVGRPGLFRSTSRLMVLDHFRVPYAVDPGSADGDLEQLHAANGGPALLWTRPATEPIVAATVLGADRVTRIPFFARVLSDELAERLLRERGGTWHRARALTSGDGAPLGSIWRADDGSVFVPFDPNEVVENFWTERYLHTTARPVCSAFAEASMIGLLPSAPAPSAAGADLATAPVRPPPGALYLSALAD